MYLAISQNMTTFSAKLMIRFIMHVIIIMMTSICAKRSWGRHVT